MLYVKDLLAGKDRYEKIAHIYGYPSIPLISSHLQSNMTEALIAFYDRQGVLKTYFNLDPYLIINILKETVHV